MPSRYDDLNAHRELEQVIAADLRRALEPRGCIVRHNGRATSPAPGGRADIEIEDTAGRRLILVEVTRRRGSQADGEFPAIKDHLDQAVAAGGYDDYGLLYVSPRTSARMSSNIRETYDRAREREGRPGRIVALDFTGLQMLVDRLIQSDPSLYPAARLGDLLARWEEATDDARAKQLVQRTLLREDLSLAHDLEEEALRRDAEREQELRRQLAQVEDRLREHGITGNAANTTLVYLTFMRLYEERRLRRGEPNRFTRAGFTEWSRTVLATERRRHANKLVGVLLAQIADDEELRAAGLLTDQPWAYLHPNVTDELVTSVVLKVFDDYDFQGGRVDVLGAVFETLARRSEKDTRVGQFFTPQTVVDFCADIVDLRPTDRVLDPAVGTGRFLIAAMQNMLAQAETTDAPQREVERRIRQELLLGTDIDGWVATIAKMNAFIHGDGKSGIVEGNGLTLGDRTVFANYPDGLDGQVDVVLTNPPLGESDFTVAADRWKQLPAREGASRDEAAFYESLGVVPLEIVQQRQLDEVQEQFRKAEERIEELQAAAPGTQSRGALSRAYGRLRELDERVRELRAALQAGEVTRRPRGRTLKGGALFLGAIARYLNPRRLSEDAPVEWRGGRVAIVVDEAILNTLDYAKVRQFLRQQFFIKAVVSLDRQAFEYLAHTTAKTSVLYLVRKPDPAIVQREPIFFAHADRVGYDRRGRWIGDDLPQVLLHWREFETAVRSCYRGAHLDTGQALATAQALPGHAVTFTARHDPGGDGRLDYFDARARQLVEQMQAGGRAGRLSDLLEVRAVAAPPASLTGEYEFAQVSRVDGQVVPRGVQQTRYKPDELWIVRAGDLVVSGIDLLNGAIAVAHDDVDGLVMSKEMYAYRIRPGVPADPDYVAALLRTDAARDLIHGLITGTSNRTRLQSAAQLLQVPIPPLPGLPEQQEAAATLRRARDLALEADRLRRRANADAARPWERVGVEAEPAAAENPDEEMSPVMSATPLAVARLTA